MKKSPYTILLICEGENTEPNFFKSIRDGIIDKEFDIGNVKLTIYPEPKIEEEPLSKANVKHKPERKKRKLKKTDSEIEIKITGAAPLSWVLAGKKELKEGTYDEVWVVFDRDNHPKRKEAFAEAGKEINGKKIKIAFSSRSFEYYLLLHFERKYYKFKKTDCYFKEKNKGKKDKKVRVWCGTNKHPELDCFGKVCINGYSHFNNYWSNQENENTKSNFSTFSLIKNTLEKGFINSAWLRNKSDLIENNILKHDRNPYITIDLLVKRLTGNDCFKHQWISLNERVKFKNIEILVANNQIDITNLNKNKLLIPENSFSVINNNRKIDFGERKIIDKQKNAIYNIKKYFSAGNWFIFTYDKYKIMFEYEA